MIDINILSNIYRIKYDCLNTVFESYKNTRTNFVFVMDIGRLLKSHMDMINKTQIIISKQDKSKVLISILNIIAHYKHYYTSIGCNHTFILYCGEHSQYDEYLDIINDIIKITQFLPGIIVVPAIKGIKNKYIYYHLVYYLLQKIVSDMNVLGKKCVINVLGNNMLEYQYLFIHSSLIFLCPFNDIKFQTCKSIWKELLGNDIRFDEKKYSLELRTLLIPYLLIHRRLKDDTFDMKYSIHKNPMRIEKLFDFIRTRIGILPIYLEYGQYMVPQYYNEYSKTINNILFVSSGNKIKDYIDDLSSLWSQKLKDRKIYSINEHLNTYGENLNIQWLLEGANVRQ